MTLALYLDSEVAPVVGGRFGYSSTVNHIVIHCYLLFSSEDTYVMHLKKFSEGCLACQS